MKSIQEAGSLKGKKVLVRVDWNVPNVNGEVADEYRIRKSLPTIEYLLKEGAEVDLVTHLEPEGSSTSFLEKYVPEGAKLLENLRKDKGEKANTPEFAEKISKGYDMFVNEAFSASHREHASIVSVPKLLPSFAGLQFMEEVKELSKAFYPKHPFLFILGGAKFDTKLPLIDKFARLADHVFVGGALAHNFFRVMGVDIGASLVSEGEFDLKESLNSGKIMLPEDPIRWSNRIVDAGPITIEMLEEKVKSAKFILWNGPLGEYESGYKSGTIALAKVIAESGVESIVGGGDTLATIHEEGLLDKFSFVSTGGGAMLDFLSSGTLPGIEALK